MSETAPLPDTHRLGQRVAVASFYAVLQRMVLRGISLVSTLILVRLLTPEDFGIVGVASVVATILEILTVTGFGLALIRMRDPQPVHYDTVFTLTVGRALLLATILIATSGWQAAFMGDPRIAPVIWVMALTLVISSLQSIRMFDLQRDLRFDVLLRYHVLEKVVGFAVGIPLAFWMRSYWALVLATLTSRIVMVPLSYRICPYRPRFGFGAWREFLHFSKWLFLGNLCTVADQQMMNVVIGRMQGVAAVGLFQVAYQIAAMPITEIAAPIRAPTYAGFTRVRHDLAELRRHVLAGLGLQWLVILPLSAGIALTAPEITLFLLGERWTALVPLMPLVGLFALFDALGVYLYNIFIAMGRQGRFVISYAGLVVVRLVLVISVAGPHGLVGAAWAMLATSLLNTAIWLPMAARLIELAPGPILAVLWRPTAAALLMTVAVLGLPQDLAARLGLAFWPVATLLLAKCALGALVYGAAVLAFWRLARRPAPSAEAHLLLMAGRALDRLGLSVWRHRPAA